MLIPELSDLLRTSELLKLKSYFFPYLFLSLGVMSRADIGNA